MDLNQGLIVDFSEMSEPLKPGTYNARISGFGAKGDGNEAIKEISWTDSKEGSPTFGQEKSMKLFVVQFEVFGSTAEDLNGRKFIGEFALSGFSTNLTKQLLEAASGQILEGKPSDFQLSPEMLAGREVSCVLAKATDKQGNELTFPRLKSVHKVPA